MSNPPASPETENDVTGAQPDDWAAWTIHLRMRRSRPTLVDILHSPRTSPWLWSRPEEAEEADATCRLLHDFLRKATKTDAKKKKSRKSEGAQAGRIAERLEQWLHGLAARDLDIALALECLAWTEALPELAAWLPAAPWSQLSGSLCDLAEQAVDAYLSCPLATQLYAGELPYRLAYGLPELERCRALEVPARNSMSQGLINATDGEGLPQANQLSSFRPLLASLTRCKLLADGFAPSLNEEANMQLDWCVTQALRLASFDGHQVLKTGATGAWDANWLPTFIDLLGDEKDIAAARIAAPRGKRLWGVESTATENSQQRPHKKSKRKKTKQKEAVELRSPSVCSEWSELCVMRSSWKKSDPSWTVAFHDGCIQSELSVSREVIWQGEWTLELWLEGEPLQPNSEWSQNCWHEDSDVCYLELECELRDGWSVQRQMLLAKEDGFLLVADAVLGETAGKIKYRSRLPLQETIGLRASEETRDGMLFHEGGKPVARILPLAFPEWRIEKSSGELRNTLEGLQWEAEAHGQALYAPLLFDLRGNRFAKEATWRQLTVARQLSIEPRDRAHAYRAQIGNDQWVFYRSLTPPDNRTFLGQNIVSEFSCGRFLRSGEVETLIELS